MATTDRALDRASADDLENELITAIRSGLAERFTAARVAKNFQPGDVASGRAYVAAYVPLIHWVEGVYTAARGEAEHCEAVRSHDGTAHAEEDPHAR